MCGVSLARLGSSVMSRRFARSMRVLRPPWIGRRARPRSAWPELSHVTWTWRGTVRARSLSLVVESVDSWTPRGWPDAAPHRPEAHPGDRLRADRHRAGLRVRLLGHPGLPGAAGGGHPG